MRYQKFYVDNYNKARLYLFLDRTNAIISIVLVIVEFIHQVNNQKLPNEAYSGCVDTRYLEVLCTQGEKQVFHRSIPYSVNQFNRTSYYEDFPSNFKLSHTRIIFGPQKWPLFPKKESYKKYDRTQNEIQTELSSRRSNSEVQQVNNSNHEATSYGKRQVRIAPAYEIWPDEHQRVSNSILLHSPNDNYNRIIPTHDQQARSLASSDLSLTARRLRSLLFTKPTLEHWNNGQVARGKIGNAWQKETVGKEPENENEESNNDNQQSTMDNAGETSSSAIESDLYLKASPSLLKATQNKSIKKSSSRRLETHLDNEKDRSVVVGKKPTVSLKRTSKMLTPIYPPGDLDRLYSDALLVYVKDFNQFIVR